MKLAKLLPRAEIVMISVSAVLFVGCGKAPSTDGSAANAIQAEALRKEVASLKAKLANAQSLLESLREQIDSGGAPSVTGGMSVPEILDELMQTSMSYKNRRRAQRRLSYLFESLALQGDAAVPLIREFLNKMEDVDFAVQREGESDEERKRRYSRFRATLNFSQPPTLRIGLMDMLAEIGGDHAEATIAELLSSTGRGLEIAYAAKIIQGWLGKDAYRTEVLAAAHELLLDPVEAVGGNHFDRVSKNYLFMVLDMYDDKTFIQSAQGMFINDDGRIDRTILDYYDNVGRVDALDAMVQAFRSGRVHEDDMDNLAEAASRYAGINPQADQLFRDIMTGDQYNMETKMDAIRSFTQSDGDPSTDRIPPNVLQARLNLVNNLHYDESDLMGKGMQLLALQLESQISGERLDERKMRDTASRLFRDMQKRESEKRRSGQRTSSGQPTIVPAP
ncbi:MAG: hypothetical protein QF497_07105 [Verrucomicrobiota bacterium]|jgi:hypothetical protein|nr:hypothetical protein [Verrucomicrobiota bacterium]MDP6250350.1 hypothetical protein [Verrucomicrobiota bacterium]MDP7291980.1 hypothetical protein [Verrucomicrobiota bacterium]|tara:strand:+ start:424 stop:1770 length:1347 start_codon:yes stop_codon:yes gene_type:complete